MICEAAVLVEIDDNQATSSLSASSHYSLLASRQDSSPLLPVFRVPDSVVQVLNQLLPGSSVAERVHRIYRAALGIIVGEGGEGAVCDVRVEFGRVNDLRHGVILDPLARNVRIGEVSAECWRLPCTYMRR